MSLRERKNMQIQCDHSFGGSPCSSKNSPSAWESSRLVVVCLKRRGALCNTSKLQFSATQNITIRLGSNHGMDKAEKLWPIFVQFGLSTSIDGA